LYAIAISDSVAYRWRFHGILPTYEGFVNSFNQEVLVQYGVVDRSSNVVSGLATAYGANLRNGYTYVASFVSEKLQRAGLGVEATIVFIHYLFSTFRLHKVYIEAPEFSLNQYGAAIDARFLVREGCLKDHVFMGGRFWDQYVLAAYLDNANHAFDWLNSLRGGGRGQ
jgi:hypothetical protein